MKFKRILWNSFVGRGVMVLLLSGIILIGIYTQTAASPRRQSSSEGQNIFEQKCISCHSIGGGVVVGPDLDGVLDRRDRDWVIKFISVPDQMLAAGDPIATEMLAEYNSIPMPNLDLTATEIEALLIFFEGGESVAQVAVTLPVGDTSRGEAIFAGRQALEDGGTPCIACHTVGDVGSFGGGNLGPDLTHVYQRFGETGLTSAIQNIAFPTMQGVYADKPLTNQEVADLLAFFTAVDTQDGEGAAKRVTPLFWAAGVLSAGVLFGVMAIFWPRQRENLSDRLRKDGSITSRRDA